MQDVLVVAELVSAANLIGGVSGGSAGASITTNGTINTATRTAKVLVPSAVTGVIVASGLYDGQELTIINVSTAASSITFATSGSAAASSHIATDTVFSGARCAKFVWESTTAMWYPVAY